LTVALENPQDGGYQLVASQTLPSDPGRTTRRFAVDTTSPGITIRRPRPGAVYGPGERVIADYSCQGAASCMGTVADGAPIDTSPAGIRVFVVRAADAAGNEVTQRVEYRVAAAPTPAPPPAGGAAAAPSPPSPPIRLAPAPPREQDVRRQALIVFSDGEDTSSLVSFDEMLDLAKRSETSIYAIALRDANTQAKGFREAEFVMRTLARETGGRAFFPNDISDLEGVSAQIADELASQYTLGYTSANQRRDGAWRRVIVRVARENVTPRTKQGYYAPTAR
jgi:hypothetical protein